MRRAASISASDIPGLIPAHTTLNRRLQSSRSLQWPRWLGSWGLPGKLTPQCQFWSAGRDARLFQDSSDRQPVPIDFVIVRGFFTGNDCRSQVERFVGHPDILTLGAGRHEPHRSQIHGPIDSLLGGSDRFRSGLLLARYDHAFNGHRPFPHTALDALNNRIFDVSIFHGYGSKANKGSVVTCLCPPL
jgi:hypothetical protein